MIFKPTIERLKKMFGIRTPKEAREARKQDRDRETADILNDLHNARSAIRNFSATAKGISKTKRESVQKLEECNLPVTIDSMNEFWARKKTQ